MSSLEERIDGGKKQLVSRYAPWINFLLMFIDLLEAGPITILQDKIDSILIMKYL